MADYIQPYEPTDYSSSPMEKDRIEKLLAAEREYINGVPNEDGDIEWPTYRGLSEKYAIPVRVVNEQAAKHRWNARRERRKSQLLLFKSQQMQRAWADMDREYTQLATQAISDLQFVVNRKLYEMKFAAMRAISEDVKAHEKGDVFHLTKMDVKDSDLRTMAATIKDLDATQAARANRAQQLPMGFDEIEPPRELGTAQEEAAELQAAAARELPSAGVMDIMREIIELEKRAFDRLDNNGVIEGQLADDDE
jgi:hypothetical protein